MKKVILCLSIIILILIINFVFIVPKFSNKKEVKEKEINQKYKEFSSLYNSIFGYSYEKAYDKMKEMSIEEKIGQLFVVRYNKDEINNFSNYYPSGYVLFAKDFENHNKNSIKEELNNISSNIPLSFMVDEEGGYVTRISRYPSFRSEKFNSPRSYYDEGGYSLLEDIEREKDKLLLELGINVNLAPVADVSVDSNDYIYNRSFGYDAKKTSEFIKHMVKYANDEGISSCLKHFPGYGNNLDTHTGSAFDKRSYATFTKSDYLPFIAGIKEDVPMILFSHNVMECVDKDLPASLSLKVHDELRNKLKFSGIIITDDLAMEAVKGVYPDAVVKAVNASNDLIITSDFINDYNNVLNAYNNNEISIKTIDLAVTRILAWKYKYNII